MDGMDRHTATDDLLDHITEFEILCSQDSWPDETKASLFLETLTPGLKSSIRRSDVDLEAYEKVKQKAQRLEREFQDTRSSAGKGRILRLSQLLTGLPLVNCVRSAVPIREPTTCERGCALTAANRDTWPRIALGPRALPSRQQSGSLQSKFLLTSAITARKTQSLTDHFRRGCSDGSFHDPLITKEMNITPIRNELVTITTIDQRRIDLGTENVRIYRVQGRIPAFGNFEAETIELPLGPDTDLVLGADWMGKVGLLDSIAKKLGIVTGTVAGAGSDDEDESGDDGEDYENRQDAINDITTCASVRVDRRWTPFQPRQQRFSPVNSPSSRQTEQEDLKVELASAINEVQDGTPRIPKEYADFGDVFAGTISADDFKLPPPTAEDLIMRLSYYQEKHHLIDRNFTSLNWSSLLPKNK
ncbi:hypothetical protein V1519DRAFT_501459 [Lipomyces tetrasporus]